MPELSLFSLFHTYTRAVYLVLIVNVLNYILATQSQANSALLRCILIQEPHFRRVNKMRRKINSAPLGRHSPEYQAQWSTEVNLTLVLAMLDACSADFNAHLLSHPLESEVELDTYVTSLVTPEMIRADTVDMVLRSRRVRTLDLCMCMCVFVVVIGPFLFITHTQTLTRSAH
jgi:hypothetical protein